MSLPSALQNRVMENLDRTVVVRCDEDEAVEIVTRGLGD